MCASTGVAAANRREACSSNPAARSSPCSVRVLGLTLPLSILAITDWDVRARRASARWLRPARARASSSKRAAKSVTKAMIADQLSEYTALLRVLLRLIALGGGRILCGLYLIAHVLFDLPCLLSLLGLGCGTDGSAGGGFRQTTSGEQQRHAADGKQGARIEGGSTHMSSVNPMLGPRDRLF